MAAGGAVGSGMTEAIPQEGIEPPTSWPAEVTDSEPSPAVAPEEGDPGEDTVTPAPEKATDTSDSD